MEIMNAIRAKGCHKALKKVSLLLKKVADFAIVLFKESGEQPHIE